MVRISNNSSKPRSDRAARKFHQKRRLILRAAAEAFRTQGFAATGMRDIARLAELSPANLYYYFDSKVELLYFCQDLALDRMLAAVEEAGRSGAPPAEKLRAVIEAQIACMLDELDGAAAHVEVDALSPELRKRIVNKRDRYERAVRKIIEAGLASGDFVAGSGSTKDDATLITRAILGALNWTARWYRPQGRLTSARVADGFAAYLVRGLLP